MADFAADADHLDKVLAELCLARIQAICFGAMLNLLMCLMPLSRTDEREKRGRTFAMPVQSGKLDGRTSNL